MPSTEFDRPALTARAVAASVSVASAAGIRVNDPHLLADTYSVRVHLKPAPIVARIATLTPGLRSPRRASRARARSAAASCRASPPSPTPRPAIARRVLVGPRPLCRRLSGCQRRSCSPSQRFFPPGTPPLRRFGDELLALL